MHKIKSEIGNTCSSTCSCLKYRIGWPTAKDQTNLILVGIGPIQPKLQTNPMEQWRSSEAGCRSAIQEIPRLLWIRIRNSPPWGHILSQINPLHTLHHISIRTILNASLPNTPCSSELSLPSRHSKQNPVRTPHPSHASCMSCQTQPPRFILIIGEDYKLCSSSLCNFLQPPVTSLPLGPNILLSILFSNTANLCSCLKVTDQVSLPHKTQGKSIVLYISIFTFLQADRKTKDSELHGSKHIPNFTCF
jgi:hypothetical protein